MKQKYMAITILAGFSATLIYTDAVLAAPNTPLGTIVDQGGSLRIIQSPATTNPYQSRRPPNFQQGTGPTESTQVNPYPQYPQGQTQPIQGQAIQGQQVMTSGPQTGTQPNTMTPGVTYQPGVQPNTVPQGASPQPGMQPNTMPQVASPQPGMQPNTMPSIAPSQPAGMQPTTMPSIASPQPGIQPNTLPSGAPQQGESPPRFSAVPTEQNAQFGQPAAEQQTIYPSFSPPAQNPSPSPTVITTPPVSSQVPQNQTVMPMTPGPAPAPQSMQPNSQGPANPMTVPAPATTGTTAK